MSEEGTEGPPDYRHLLVIGMCGVAMIAAAVAIRLTTSLNPVWSDLGLHLGTGILLFAVLFFVERRYVVIAVRAQTEEVLTRADNTLARIDRHLEELLTQRSTDDESSAHEFGEQGDFRSLLSLLQRAQRLRAISRYGVRAGIGSTDYCLRVHPTVAPFSSTGKIDAKVAIQCIVETRDRRPEGGILWTAESSPAEVFVEVFELLARAGHAPVLEAYDAHAIRENLARTLLAALRSRTNEDGVIPLAGRVLEQLSDDWVITTEGLENLHHKVHYSIEQLRSRRSPEMSDDFSEATEPSDAIFSAARETWRPHDSGDPYSQDLSWIDLPR